MANKGIESEEFRRAARRNCYRYGCFYVHTDDYTSLDEHSFPNYQMKEGTGSVEKFLSLIQSLGVNASGNDPSQKLAKPLPGVGWNDSDLGLSVSVSGTMYFLDYRDYVSCKNAIHKEFVAQGWKQFKSASQTAGISVLTYIPTKNGSDALFNDDPIDAAGMAMLTSAMQNATLRTQQVVANVKTQGKQGGTLGRIIGVETEPYDYAEVTARLEVRQAMNAKKHPTLSKLGSFGSDIGAAIDAFGANMNSGLVAKWSVAGNPVELIVEDVVVARSVNGVLTSAKLTEQAYVVDDSSGGQLYPTEMRVDLQIKNLYGSLLTASSVE